MIIHRVVAHNVLKYGRLILEDLPEQGIIAVSGPNESGKSSIGETICFATFSVKLVLRSEGARLRANRICRLPGSPASGRLQPVISASGDLGV